MKETSRNRFRYTVNTNGILNDRQRQFYEENGFVVIPNLVSHDQIDDCQQRFLDIIDGKVPKGKLNKELLMYNFLWKLYNLLLTYISFKIILYLL